MCCDSMHAVRCGLWSIVKRLYVLYRASPFRDVRASVDCYGWSPLHECILQTQCICTGHSLTVFLCINNVRTSPKKILAVVFTIHTSREALWYARLAARWPVRMPFRLAPSVHDGLMQTNAANIALRHFAASECEYRRKAF